MNVINHLKIEIQKLLLLDYMRSLQPPTDAELIGLQTCRGKQVEGGPKKSTYRDKSENVVRSYWGFFCARVVNMKEKTDSSDKAP